MLQVLSFVAENERTSIRQRQAEGIVAAKKRGGHFGCPFVPPPDDVPAIAEAWEAGRLSFSEALRKSGLAQAAFYRRLRKYRLIKEAK